MAKLYIHHVSFNNETSLYNLFTQLRCIYQEHAWNANMFKSTQ